MQRWTDSYAIYHQEQLFLCNTINLQLKGTKLINIVVPIFSCCCCLIVLLLKWNNLTLRRAAAESEECVARSKRALLH